MLNGLLRKSVANCTIAATLVGALAAGQATPAFAATVSPIYSDGGTLAAFVYRQIADAYGFPLGGTSCTQPPNKNCKIEFLYGAIGTGGSQSAFVAHAASSTVPATGEPAYTDSRFPAYPYPELDWAAGDAPINTTLLGQYQTTVNGSGTDQQRFGNAIVVPTMASPVAFGYNPSGLTVPSGGLRLSRNSFCGIFNGDITNWNDPSITADNGAPVSSSLPINVVVRSDGSGTTFIFSNALNKQCASTSHSFSKLGGVGTGGGTAAPIFPTTFDQQKGSSGVEAEILAKAGSIGYLGSNYVQPFASNGPPAANLQNQYDITHHTTSWIAPTVAASKIGLKGPYDSTGPCGTVGSTQTCYPNPVTNQILYDSNPTNLGAYPIVGFTYGYFYQCGNNSTEVNGLKAMFRSYVYAVEHSGVLTPADQIVENNGLVELTNTIKSKSAGLLLPMTTGPVSGTCTL